MTDANSLFVFPETGAKVRVVQIEGAPWFVAADLCRALSLKEHKRGFGHHFEKLADDERQMSPMKRLGLKVEGRGGARTVLLVSESGLYKLVLRAHPDRNPAVRKFQDWVTRDVLPAIRKDGVYVRGEELLANPAAHGLDLNDLDTLRDQIELLQKRKAELLEKRLAEATEKLRVAEAELNVVTLDEYRALTHRYMRPEEKSRLASAASRLAKSRGVELGKQERRVWAGRKGWLKVYVNVYPRNILEEAERLLQDAA